MKKTIYGKRYDTDKSTVVASQEFGYRTETLYLSPNGLWFLVTLYKAPDSPTWEVFSKAQAVNWLSDYGFENEIDQYLADHVSDA